METQKKIFIGWGSRDITPNKKVSLQGQFYTRFTEEVHDPLTVTALALSTEDGLEQAIIVSFDSGSSSDTVLEGCRAVLQKKCPDFNVDKIFISATHTHTAPELPQTFVVQLAGEGGYLPTERGMKGGSYGAFIPSTPVGPEGGQEIVEKSVETINGFWGE